MTQKVKDDGRDHKYFHIIPNMADDDLDPYQYRLYGHYKRICGDTGSCNESVRQTAKITQMSEYKVQKARDELAALGYISVVKPTPQDARKGHTVHITLDDLWQQNISRYAKAVSNLTQGAVSNPTQQPEKAVSDLTQETSEAVSNLTRSTYKELKDIQEPKEKKKKEKSISSSKKKRGRPRKSKTPTVAEIQAPDCSAPPPAADDGTVTSLEDMQACANEIEAELDKLRNKFYSSRNKVKRNDIPRPIPA